MMWSAAQPHAWMLVVKRFGQASRRCVSTTSRRRCWRQHLGRKCYPEASTLTIPADCGDSNGNRTRLWKKELQCPGDDTGLSAIPE